MRIRANIVSAGPNAPDGWRTAAVERVPVFHTALGRVVGTAGEFQVLGDDLWAWLELEDGCPEQARCCGILMTNGATLRPRLVAVCYTNLTRGQLRGLGGPL